MRHLVIIASLVLFQAAAYADSSGFVQLRSWETAEQGQIEQGKNLKKAKGYASQLIKSGKSRMVFPDGSRAKRITVPGSVDSVYVKEPNPQAGKKEMTRSFDVKDGRPVFRATYGYRGGKYVAWEKTGATLGSHPNQRKQVRDRNGQLRKAFKVFKGDRKPPSKILPRFKMTSLKTRFGKTRFKVRVSR